MDFKSAKISNSTKETEEIGKNFAKFLNSNFLTPIVISLEGELGGGKTTFIKGFAQGLGIKEMVKSPTFVIMKKYEIKFGDRETKAEMAIRKSKLLKLENFYHFDCYRAREAEDILELGWKKIIGNHKNIVAVEWGDKIKNIMPKNYIQIKFKFVDKNKRKITIKT